MFSIYDGRTQFYQWDLDRKLVVNDPTIEKVHFCNRTGSCSLVRCVYEVNGKFFVDVPNIILQESYRVNVYGFDANYTKHSTSFNIVARTKPEDYVYTETEVAQWEALEARVTEIEEKGVNADMIAAAVEDYLPGSATITELNSRIDEANAKITENENDFTEHEQKYKALNIQVQTLEGNVEIWRDSHLDMINDHNRRLNDHESRISELEQNSGESEGTNLPEGMPGQYLKTDENGNVVWADEKRIRIEEFFDLETSSYSYTCSISVQELYEIISDKRFSEYNIELIGEDHHKYYFSSYSIGQGSGMLYFIRVTQTANSQSSIQSRVIRITNKSVLSYFNAFAHNIPNIAAPQNNGADYVLHHKNGSAYWEAVSNEEEEEGNIPESLIMVLDDNGQLSIVGGNASDIFNEDNLLNAMLAVTDANNEAVSLYHIAGITANGIILFFNGKREIGINTEGGIYYLPETNKEYYNIHAQLYADGTATIVTGDYQDALAAITAGKEIRLILETGEMQYVLQYVSYSLTANNINFSAIYARTAKNATLLQDNTLMFYDILLCDLDQVQEEIQKQLGVIENGSY